MIQVISKINAQSEREFNRTLSDYLKVSKRSVADVLNNKAYYIAVNAVNLTHKADKGHIQRDLGKTVTVKFLSKKGKARKRTRVAYSSTSRTRSGAPLAALIVNARKGRGGKPGLQGSKMEQAIRRMIGARNRSVNFLRSSWIPAIKRLAPLVKKAGGPRPDTTVKQAGQPKGGCQPSIINGTTVKASIWSSISKQAAYVRQVLEHGINAAMRKETASMKEYMAKKLAEDTKHFS